MVFPPLTIRKGFLTEDCVRLPEGLLRTLNEMPVSSLTPNTDCAEVRDNSLLGKSLKVILSDLDCEMVEAFRCVESDSKFEEKPADTNNINMYRSCLTVRFYCAAKIQKFRISLSPIVYCLLPKKDYLCRTKSPNHHINEKTLYQCFSIKHHHYACSMS